MLRAQEADRIIKKGNDAYTKGDYKNAAELYKKALTKDSKNNIARFNLGNAQMKQKDVLSAEKYYEEVAATENDASLKAKAFYNKGVVEVREQKLVEAIDAFKQALLLTPDDDEMRENLQKALNELKQQQQQNSPKQNKENKQKQKQKKQPSNPEMMEQKFSELRDKEKQLQKMLQRKPNNNQPEKDW
jgi:tetratricopeptide (TPR) repeat protein